MQYIGRLGTTDQLPQDGIHVGQISRGTDLDLDSVKDGVENLIAEGHLYSTIDDEQCVLLLIHWMSLADSLYAAL